MITNTQTKNATNMATIAKTPTTIPAIAPPERPPPPPSSGLPVLGSVVCSAAVDVPVLLWLLVVVVFEEEVDEVDVGISVIPISPYVV